VHGTGGVASAGVPDRRISLQLARPHRGPEPGSMGLHGQSHFNLENPEWVLPDRNTIPHDVRFFQNLRELIHLCVHRRGALALAHDRALSQPRRCGTQRTRAGRARPKTKRTKPTAAMDGAWTGHPDQNEIAVAQSSRAQPVGKSVGRAGYQRGSISRSASHSKGIGKPDIGGTRAPIRTVIRYRNGMLNGKAQPARRLWKNLAPRSPF